MLVIFVPLLLMDTVGRRPLLIASNVGICLAQLLISMSFLFGPDNSSGVQHPYGYVVDTQCHGSLLTELP
eukprot:COSAG02_NODE_24_length_52386_cov_726.042898_10_plen_70_part_00